MVARALRIALHTALALTLAWWLGLVGDAGTYEEFLSLLPMLSYLVLVAVATSFLTGLFVSGSHPRRALDAAYAEKAAREEADRPPSPAEILTADRKRNAARCREVRRLDSATPCREDDHDLEHLWSASSWHPVRSFCKVCPYDSAHPDVATRYPPHVVLEESGLFSLVVPATREIVEQSTDETLIYAIQREIEDPNHPLLDPQG